MKYFHSLQDFSSCCSQFFCAPQCDLCLPCSPGSTFFPFHLSGTVGVLTKTELAKASSLFLWFGMPISVQFYKKTYCEDVLHPLRIHTEGSPGSGSCESHREFIKGLSPTGDRTRRGIQGTVRMDQNGSLRLSLDVPHKCL